MNKTKIEYLTHSWNPIAMRCTPVGPGCKNCWHLAMANRLASNPAFSDEVRAAYSGEGQPVLVESRLEEPLRCKKPARVGVQFMGDLFHEDVPFRYIERVFCTMYNSPEHTFLILTKRSARMLEAVRWMQNLLTLSDDDWLRSFPHVWFGISAENQATADERTEFLLQTPAVKHFLSLEPLLGEIDLFRAVYREPSTYLLSTGEYGWPDYCNIRNLNGTYGRYENGGLNLIIAGTESGPKRRPAELDWLRNLRDQCQAAGVPFFLKQAEINGKVEKMPELDGKQWNEWPKEVEDENGDVVAWVLQWHYNNRSTQTT